MALSEGKRAVSGTRKTNKKNNKNNKKAVRIVLILVAVLAVCGIGIYALLNSKLFGGSDVDMSAYKSPEHVAEKSVNFLVVGMDQDDDRELYQGRYLTDVMMVVSFDMENKKISILQLPRDTYVGPKYPSGKLNAVYNNGPHKDQKILNLIELINRDYQLPIDHYVALTMTTFRNAIDAVGGIEMEVPWDIEIKNEGLSIPAGNRVLTGKEAEAFVRCREIYAEGDIGRVKAQRVFLSAAMEKLTTLSANELIKLISMCYDQIETDLTTAQILGFAQKASTISLDSMEMFMLPGESTTSPENLSVWTVHKQETADLLNEKFRPYSDPVAASELKCIEVSNTYQGYNQNGNSAQDILDGAKPGKDTVSKKDTKDNTTANKK